ncbi:MAG TPA: NDP-sugar synthase [Candidatus Binataceae bacterium]|nr:NDP-sugar synthase [Candidatus Binataceae bacterium]
MKALILAAGMGERLRPLTNRIPKPILEVGGRPLIHYSLLMLKRAGITEVAINVHHLAGEIESALGSGNDLGVNITYAPEPTLLGTGGTLLALGNYFGDEPFWVLNADSILDLDLSGMLALHRDQGALVTFALFRPANINRYSKIEIDSQARVRRVRLLKNSGEFDDYPPERGADGAALESYMFCGVYLCEPKALTAMPQNPPFSSMREIFAPMVAQGLPLFGYVHRGFFRTVDDLNSYEALKREFASAQPALSYL